VRNAADIPDLVQEVFLRLLRVPNLDTIRAPEAYLFTIAHHVAQQHALRSAVSASSIELGEVLNEVLAATDCDPALEVSAQQCMKQLEDALRARAENPVRISLLSPRRLVDRRDQRTARRLTTHGEKISREGTRAFS
jgi:DNA-directed RNA polymerase specialized sigma24 family protein